MEQFRAPPAHLLVETVAAEEGVVSSAVCSLSSGERHVVVNHGSSLSVLAVRANLVQCVARHDAGMGRRLLFVSPVQRGASGAIFCLLSDASTLLLAFGADGRLLDHLEGSQDLALPANALLDGLTCAYDAHRCAVIVFVPLRPDERIEHANGKRMLVVSDAPPPLVWLFRFSFDFFPKVHTKSDNVVWNHEWTPTSVTFMNTKNTWSFACIAPTGMKTFAVKADERDNSVPEIRELKLSVVPPHRVSSLCFLEGTVSLMCAGSDLCLFAGTKLLQALPYGRASSDAEENSSKNTTKAGAPPPLSIFALNVPGKHEFIAALADGTLHLVSVSLTPGKETLKSLSLGKTNAGSAPATSISYLSTVTFKQGPCHLIFIGCAAGESNVAFVIPSNPKRRLNVISSPFMSLAPISGMVLMPNRRLLASFGQGSSSGVVMLERAFAFNSLIRYASEKVDDALLLDSATALILRATGTPRLVQLRPSADHASGGEQVEGGEGGQGAARPDGGVPGTVSLHQLACPALEELKGKTVACWQCVLNSQAVIVRVADLGVIELRDGASWKIIASESVGGDPIVSAELDFPYKATSLFVLDKAGVVHRLTVSPTGLTKVKSCPMPEGFSARLNQFAILGAPSLVMAVGKGQLLSDSGRFGAPWQRVNMHLLAGQTVLAVSASSMAEDPKSCVFITVLTHATNEHGVRTYSLLVRPYQFSSSLTAAPAPEARVFLFSERVSGMEPQQQQQQGQQQQQQQQQQRHGRIRFNQDSLLGHFITVQFDHGPVYCVHLSSGGSWISARCDDDYCPLVSLSIVKHMAVSLLASPSRGTALGSSALVRHVTKLKYRHSNTILFLKYIPSLSLCVIIDSGGRLLCFDPSSGTSTVTRDAVQTPYEIGDDVLVSDMCLLSSIGDTHLLALAVMPKIVESESSRCMVYSQRRILFLRVRYNGESISVSQSAQHHPINLHSVGGCQVRVAQVPFLPGGIAVAFDSYLQVMQFQPGSPDATRVWGTLLGADISANDLCTQLSVSGNFLTLLHMYGSIAVVAGNEKGEFSLHRQGILPDRNDGAAPILLGDDVLLGAGNKSLVVMTRTHQVHLAKTCSIPLHGQVSCSLYLPQGDVAAFGTTAGQIVFVRNVDKALWAQVATPEMIYIDGSKLRETQGPNTSSLLVYL